MNLFGEIDMGQEIAPGKNRADRLRIQQSALFANVCFSGDAQSGKTVAAMRFVAELSKIRRESTGKRPRIIVLDTKQDWRALASCVEPERLRVGSLGDPGFSPVRLNIWKAPQGVCLRDWLECVVGVYGRAHGLSCEETQSLKEVVLDLQERNATGDICFADIHEAYRQRHGGRHNGLAKSLSCFGQRESVECKLFGSSDAPGIDALCQGDGVAVLEGVGNLGRPFRAFLSGAVAAGLAMYAEAMDGGFFAANQNETVLVVEDAHEAFGKPKPSSGTGLHDKPPAFPKTFEGFRHGLYIVAVARKIGMLDEGFLANTCVHFVGRTSSPNDIRCAVWNVGYAERIEDFDAVQRLPVLIRGQFLYAKASRYFDGEPAFADVPEPATKAPSNRELAEMACLWTT